LTNQAPKHFLDIVTLISGKKNYEVNLLKKKIWKDQIKIKKNNNKNWKPVHKRTKLYVFKSFQRIKFDL
jgi:hypothetical protein